jgi:ribosomal protein S18 acetylase RimI-like enzyme
MKSLTSPLDNPAWNALQSLHQPYANGTANVSRYPAEILPFIAIKEHNTHFLSEITPYVDAAEKLFLIGDRPQLPENWTLHSDLECLQMVWTGLKNFEQNKTLQITMLGQQHRMEMFDFVNSIQPGYFKINTPMLGNYYGIRVHGKLAAIAGERLKMTGFTEISAVCTHPEFSGRGFAQQLMGHLFHQIRESGAVPFLHVLQSNQRAVRLYEFLGFETRRDIHFSQIGPKT